MTTVNINGHEIDPKTQVKGGAYFSSDAANSDVILLQCKNVLSVEQIEQLQSLQVQILQNVAKFTYTCQFKPKTSEELNKVRALPFVSYANVYNSNWYCNPIWRL